MAQAARPRAGDARPAGKRRAEQRDDQHHNDPPQRFNAQAAARALPSAAPPVEDTWINLGEALTRAIDAMAERRRRC